MANGRRLPHIIATMNDRTDSQAPSPRFDVVLYPNRSLGSTGFAVLMTLIVVASGLIGAGFMAIGAWPVSGFLGLDVILLFFAFRWNHRDMQRMEIVRLDRDGLLIRRILPGGEHREWHFDPAWVQIIIDEPADHGSQLRLRSHGKELIIAAFLTADERLSLAKALRSAVHAHRACASVTG